MFIGFVFLQFCIPRLYAAGYAEHFRAAYAPRGQVVVQVKAFPFFKLGSGRIDRLYLTATEVEVGGITLAALTAELLEVRAAEDRRPGQNGVRQSVGTARVAASVGEAALNTYLTAHLTNIIDVDLRLHADKVTLAGRIRFFGRLFPFFATGKLVPAAQNAITFQADSITLEGMVLPQLFTESAQAIFDSFSFPLGQSGLLEQLAVSAVETREGYAEITLTKDG